MGYYSTGGLGDVTAAQAAGAGQGAAAGALQVVGANTVGGKISGGGGMILSAAPFAGPGAPIVAIAGAVVLVAGQIISFVGWGDGCGKNCVLTSEWANKAGALLDQLMEAYFGSPVRNKSTQAAALASFDAIWAQLYAACSQPALGGAGQRCISDRQAGSCHWKALPPKWPGEPATGACWNWFNAYRDPIANDVGVVADSMIDTSSVGAAVDSLFSSAGGSSSSSLVPLLALAALVAVAVMA